MNELLARAADGDGDAEKRIFEYLRVRFETIAKHRIGNGQDAEDVAQEACLTVLQKYKTETYISGFEAWAYGVLRMKIGNHLQSAHTRRKYLAANVDVHQVAESSLTPEDYYTRRKLLDCLRRILKRHQRYGRVVNLIYQGYTTAEICTRLNITPNNLHVTLNRGRSMLKHCLQTGKV